MKLSETDKIERIEELKAEIDVVPVEMAPERKQVRRGDKPFVFYKPDGYKVPDLPGRDPIVPNRNYDANPFEGPVNFALAVMSITLAFGGLLVDRIGNNPEKGPSRQSEDSTEKA